MCIHTTGGCQESLGKICGERGTSSSLLRNICTRVRLKSLDVDTPPGLGYNPVGRPDGRTHQPHIVVVDERAVPIDVAFLDDRSSNRREENLTF